MTIAFATELGGGLGHAARLAPWLAHASERGFETLALLPDMRVVAEAPHLVGARFVQAPRLAHGPSLRDFEPASYAEMLIGAGYGNPAVLGALVDAWSNMFRLAGVSAVVADHAPTAILAARLACLPVLHVGDGFTMPPPGGAGEPYDAGEAKRTPERFGQSVQRALACINAVLAQRGGVPLASIDELVATGISVIASYPELDHRRAGRPATAFAGHFGLRPPDEEGWDPMPGPRVFAYLKPDVPVFDAVLAQLGRHAGQVRIHAQGLTRSDATGPARWTWSARPLPASAMAECDLVVCHAGHGTVCEALLAGKSLLMVPTVFEQMLTAQNVQALGAGTWHHPAQDARALRRSLRQVLEEAGPRAAAQAFAARHGGADRAARLVEIADRFLDLARTVRAG